MRQRLKQAIVLVSISGALGGCASTKEAVLPQDGPSMKAIYEAHFEGMGTRDPQALRGDLSSQPLISGDASLDGYTRDSATVETSSRARWPLPACSHRATPPQRPKTG